MSRAVVKQEVRYAAIIRMLFWVKNPWLYGRCAIAIKKYIKDRLARVYTTLKKMYLTGEYLLFQHHRWWLDDPAQCHIERPVCEEIIRHGSTNG